MTHPAFNYPALPLESWEQSKITLHLYLQIVGKIMLALKVRRNHWWHMTFKIYEHGLTTHEIPYSNGHFSIRFDFVQHQLLINNSNGDSTGFPLEDGLTVAQFYKQIMQCLNEFGIQVIMTAKPFDHPCKTPFENCVHYHDYDKENVSLYFKILNHIAHIFTVFTGRFNGKVSPVQVYWHHMDLAVTRFNGKAGPPQPKEARISDKDAYSHEVCSSGFWAGDEQVRGAAFYCYTYPSPPDLEKEEIQPSYAQWDLSNGTPMASMMYDDLRQSEDPDNDLLDFLESTYQAGAKRAHWPIDELTYVPPA